MEAQDRRQTKAFAAALAMIRTWAASEALALKLADQFIADFLAYTEGLDTSFMTPAAPPVSAAADYNGYTA
jgi:hypothetical protein